MMSKRKSESELAFLSRRDLEWRHKTLIQNFNFIAEDNRQVLAALQDLLAYYDKVTGPPLPKIGATADVSAEARFLREGG